MPSADVPVVTDENGPEYGPRGGQFCPYCPTWINEDNAAYCDGCGQTMCEPCADRCDEQHRRDKEWEHADKLG